MENQSHHAAIFSFLFFSFLLFRETTLLAFSLDVVARLRCLQTAARKGIRKAGMCTRVCCLNTLQSSFEKRGKPCLSNKLFLFSFFFSFFLSFFLFSSLSSSDLFSFFSSLFFFFFFLLLLPPPPHPIACSLVLFLNIQKVPFFELKKTNDKKTGCRSWLSGSREAKARKAGHDSILGRLIHASNDQCP